MPSAKDLQKTLSYKRRNFWKEAPVGEREAALAFAVPYMRFLDSARTVRACVNHFANLLTDAGWKNMTNGEKANKMFYVSRGKVLAAVRLGTEPVSAGLNVVAAHIDAPRIDLKPVPLYEDDKAGLAMLRTHYYGGIKKYQWMSTPLALMGVVVKRDGEIIDIHIGDSEDDPVFVMPDLLPHLAGKVQTPKKIDDAVDASRLNVVFGSMPFIDDEEDADLKETVKLQALRLLHERYGITEADLLSAELELVPAGRARDAGLDSSMILAYAQDDRVCSFAGMQALLDAEAPRRTMVALLIDKEETGSEGNTGAASFIVEDFVADLLAIVGEDSGSYNLRKTLIRSHILSADVNAAINPNFHSVLEENNAVHLGCGVALAKYSGHAGKSNCNDSNAEFAARVSHIFDDADVFWQTGELGKTDEGGGGTIAKFLARFGADVIDCGAGLLGMHALYELSSKADVYCTYRAYKAFLEKA
ncbi:MAG: aminopeptidase [Candidatus Cloacimonetes bacterium]|nr:aminopeptidase [Candidatus Cloacimonadota bacterium]